jgi:hypothetical protein
VVLDREAQAKCFRPLQAGFDRFCKEAPEFFKVEPRGDVDVKLLPWLGIAHKITGQVFG